MKSTTRILIVDDAQIIRSTLSSILEHEGYEVQTARKGRQALALASEQRFDLVLLDLKLPDADGEELIAPFKEAQPDIGVVILTGQGSMESAIRALNEGAAAYITKPWTNEEGLLTVRSVLEKQRLMVENRRLLADLQQELAERKRIENALRESEQTLSTLLSNLPGMAYRYRVSDGSTMEYVSQGAAALTGYSPARLLQGRELSFTRLIDPQDRPQVEAEIEAALAEGRPFTMTYRIHTREGEEKWVWEQGRPTNLADGGAVLEGFITDISERKRAVLASEEQQAMAEALADTTLALNGEMEIQEVLERILANVGRVVPHTAAQVMVRKGEAVHVMGEHAPALAGSGVPASAGAGAPVLRMADAPVLWRMAETGQPVVVADVAEDAAWRDFPQMPWIRSYVGAPICLREETIGFLSVNSDRAGFYDETHARRLALFANQTATALAMARLQATARRLVKDGRRRTADRGQSNVGEN